MIAPDLRGFGESQGPHEVGPLTVDLPRGHSNRRVVACDLPQVEAYGLQEVAGDLVALLDVLDIAKAVFIGHDW